MADNFKFVQAQPFRLYTSATSTQNTLIISQFETPDGVALTLADFGTQGVGTVDQGLETEEIVLWTGVTNNGNGTYTLTGVSRGGNFRAPYDFDAVARGQSHATNASFIITNNPQFYNKFASTQNDETIAQTWTFTNPNVPRMDANPTYGAGTEKYFATKQYVDDTAFAGAPNASTTQKGIVEIATQAENDNGTDTGGTGAYVVAVPSVMAKTIQESNWVYAEDTGVANAYVITLVPAPTALVPGLAFFMKAANDNTTASTLNPNGLGNITIKKYDNAAIADIASGDIQAGGIYGFVYDGTFLQLQTPPANSLPSSVASEVTTFFTAPLKQNLRSTYTFGEASAVGDLMVNSTTDTVIRSLPASIPSSFDQSASQTATLVYSNTCQTGHYLRLSNSLSAFVYCDADGANPETVVIIRVPFTASTGAVGTITNSTAVGGIAQGTCIDAVVMDSTRILVTEALTNDFRAEITDLSSAITPGATATIDNSNCSGGFCDYISDSHVLFFARDTATGAINFYKYTASGSTLTSSSTGTVTTIADTYELRGVRRFSGTNNFLIVIQNTTAGSAQAAIAVYNTGSSTFTSISSWVNFPSNVDILATAGANCVFSQLDSDMTVVGFSQTSTNFSTVLVTNSSGTPSFGTVLSTTKGANSGYTLSPINARCCYQSTINSTTATVKILETTSAGTDMTAALSQTFTEPPAGGGNLESNSITAAFRVSPTRFGWLGFLGSSDDPSVGTALLSYLPPVGIANATTAAAASGAVITHGYNDKTTGLTATTRYYQDMGGLTTSDSTGSPVKVLTATDTAESQVSIA